MPENGWVAELRKPTAVSSAMSSGSKAGKTSDRHAAVVAGLPRP